MNDTTQTLRREIELAALYGSIKPIIEAANRAKKAIREFAAKKLK